MALPTLKGLAAAFLALLALLAVAPAAHAACANPIACENAQTGTPIDSWLPDGPATSIQGFATQMSVNRGQTVNFKISTPSANYHIDIYRIGWYNGAGSRLVQGGIRPSATLPQTQPSCLSFATTGLIDCGNWGVSASWAVPSTAVSGVYVAHLQRDDNSADNAIVFVVRDDGSHSDVVYQTSDSTWQAYNTYGGNSLYQCNVNCPSGSPKAYLGASKVSYNRPITTPLEDTDVAGQNYFLYDEYAMVRFIERNGYDVSYTSGVDTATTQGGQLLLNHKMFVSSGHDEYWSTTQRQNVEAARDAGVNLAFFSGNEVFWHTRWEASQDGSNTANRTLVSYKDTHYDARVDPVSWTGTWRDPRFTIASDNTSPENSLTGQSFVVNSGTSAIKVPYAYSRLRIWRNTPNVSNLASGGSWTLAPGTLGYEWDVDADNSYRPAGAFDISGTTVSGVEAFLDYGSTTQPNSTVTHNMTEYRAHSGALVFGAGTVQWSWGLDQSSPGNNTPDRDMEQATVNLFADMGTQPGTLQSDLVGATKSADSTPPTSALTNAPTSVADGSTVTLTGTASDAGGGVVGGVEVSTDGGATWHPATSGTTSWTYTWVAHGTPTTVIKTRATDDSGNIETPGAGTSVNVTCSCSIWGNGTKPATADTDGNDTQSVEVGVRFRSDVLGTITGVRFYKAATNTGTHVGNLWAADGTKLASATFVGESASGWQSVTFPQPVTIQPNTTYTVSYFAPNGHYSATHDYFWRTEAPGPVGGAITDSGPLHAIKATDGTSVNGVFAYGAFSTFPTGSYQSSSYWVDVNFQRTPPPGQATTVAATAGGRTSANLTWRAPTSGGAPSSYKLTPYVAGAAQTPTTVPATADTSATVTGLTNGTTYTFTVTAVNGNGSGPESAQSNAVTPLNPVVPSPPTGVAARPATSSALVTWNLAASDGDSAITSQTVTPYAGATALTPVVVGASATSTTVTGLGNGTAYTFKVVATNGVGNSAPSAASGAVTPQTTLFDFATPPTVDSGDAFPVELGVKFKADYDGTVTGIRFYKASTNTGTHVGNLWAADGTRLATATFTNETASGWQTVTFNNPVSITASTTYVASYFAPNGHNSVTSGGFVQTVDNAPLHSIANGSDANGVYVQSGASAFPNRTYNANNYWVDLLYALPLPGQVTNVVAAAAGRTSASLTWTAPSSSGPVTKYRVTPYAGATAQTPVVVNATADTSTTVTGLTNGTTYTFKVEALNANGAGPASAASNAVTPLNPVAPAPPTNALARPASNSAQVTWTLPASDGDSPITGQTVTPYAGATALAPVQVSASATSAIVTGLANGTSYTFKVHATNAVGNGADSNQSGAVTPESAIFDFATPATVDSGDTTPVELGVKFRADYDGSVTGIRFYKAAANTGTHIGNLWSTNGTRLATATFTNESAVGWQTVTFASPVAVTAGTTYVASYFTPTGHNSATGAGLQSVFDNGPLHTLSNALTPNGVYAAGPSSSFPGNTYNANNYWVDVMFALPLPGQVTNVVAASGGRTSANLTWTAPSSSGPVTSYRITPYAGTTAQAPTTVPATADTSGTVSGLTNGTTYTFTVEAVNANGVGPASAASNAVTPQNPVVPAPPTNVQARPATSSAQVTWTLPASDGDSAITGQTVTPYVGAAAQTPIQVGPTATSLTASGLTNGTQYTFRVKATNGVGSGPESSASSSVTPQTTVFDFATPTTIDSGDTWPVELGMKFTADSSGSITGIRFYKSAANTGTHIGNLWAADGTRLATATFANETATGWQTVTFASPVALTAGTTYIASYFTSSGHNAFTSGGLSAAFDHGPLHTIANSQSGNGVYATATTSTFPSASYGATNYWVDVLYALPQPGQVTGVTAAAAGRTSATVSWTAPVGGGLPATYRVTPYAGATAQTPITVPASSTSALVTGLTSGTTYTFKVEALNGNGAGPASAASNAVTPQNPVAPAPPTAAHAEPAGGSALVTWTAPAYDGDSAITGETITPYVGTTAQTPVPVAAGATSATVTGLTTGTQYTFKVAATNAVGTSPQSAASNAVTPARTIFDFTTPTTIDSGDVSPVELGMKFKADTNGFITGIRFYKAAANTGTHVGNLWSIDGTRLATATFSNETASGWQTVTFASPVAVTAGTTYVASYFTPTGHNSFTSSGLTVPFDNGPLHTIANSVSADGVYAASPTSSFPVNTYNATNYWVDVLFAPTS